MKPIIRNDHPVYGGGQGGGGGGGGELDGQRSGVMAAAVFAKDIALELLTSKKTYRVTIGVLYSILFVWLLMNIAHMTGNIGRIAEPDDFWRQTRKLVKKSAGFREAHCCCPVATREMGPGREGGMKREGEIQLPPASTDPFQENVNGAAVPRGRGGGEKEEEESHNGRSYSQSTHTHTLSSVPVHWPGEEGGEERGGEKAVGGGEGGGGGGGGGGPE